MTQEMIMSLLQGAGIIVALLVFVFALWMIGRIILDRRDSAGHPKRLGSALDKDRPLPPSELGDFDANGVEITPKTSRLNPKFFLGMQQENNKPAPVRDDFPTADVPLTIMARHGKHFSGEALQQLFSQFGLQRSPSNVFELITEKGDEVLFSVLNVRHPGVFPKDLSELRQIEGLLLILQLPAGDNQMQSLEMFLAIASDMADSIGGRLCDHERVPMATNDLLVYRQAAEEFEAQYNHWLAAQS